MKPFSNKVNVLLLIITIGLLLYILTYLATILSRVAVMSGPIYPLYITIRFLASLIVSLVVLLILRAKLESNKLIAGYFYRMKIDFIKNEISNPSGLSNQMILAGFLNRRINYYRYGIRQKKIEVRSNAKLGSRNWY